MEIKDGSHYKLDIFKCNFPKSSRRNQHSQEATPPLPVSTSDLQLCLLG